MLSEDEKRDLLDKDYFLSLERDFVRMKENLSNRPLDIDGYMRFLTGINRFCGPLPPPPPHPYERPLI